MRHKHRRPEPNLPAGPLGALFERDYSGAGPLCNLDYGTSALAGQHVNAL